MLFGNSVKENSPRPGKVSKKKKNSSPYDSLATKLDWNPLNNKAMIHQPTHPDRNPLNNDPPVMKPTQQWSKINYYKDPITTTTTTITENQIETNTATHDTMIQLWPTAQYLIYEEREFKKEKEKTK